MSEVKISNDPIKFVTPVAGQTIMLRPFVPARLRIEVRKLILRNASISLKKASKAKNQKELEAMDIGELTNLDDVPADVIEDINVLTAKTMVISIDGKTDDIEDELLNMRQEDYDAIIKKSNEISAESSVDDKKK